MGGPNPVPNVLCVHNNVEPRSQQNTSKSRVTGKNSPCSAGARKLHAQPLGVAWAAPVLLVSCLRSSKDAWVALLVLVQPASNSSSNNPFFLAFLHESFAFNVLLSLSKSFLNA
ncbi:hypothetical protein PIB30_103592 [Stylosanthes scabra]|uniref:Uncharacterized protein n=1 Tax=Stylosanthes scabra TaxID=79078 RepID=A0ABU6RYI8_9FABA|nr:hypothetical protein [Stylosanthes scabra]